MKVRIGYVSNSSSSSFLMYGIDLDYHEALEQMGEGAVYCIVENGGMSGDCADFVFRMSRGRMDLLEKNHVDVSKALFLKMLKEFVLDEGMVDIDEPLSGGAIHDISKDESSPWDDRDDNPNFVKWVEDNRRCMQ